MRAEKHVGADVTWLLCCPVLTRIEMSRQLLLNSLAPHFMKTPLGFREMLHAKRWADRWTTRYGEVKKRNVAISSFANTPEKGRKT
jgi:hypothetical protein